MQSRKLMISRSFFALCLVFDPDKSTHYKVVSFTWVESSICYSLYHSETDEWKKGGEFHIGREKYYYWVYLNDVIYFIRCCDGSLSCFALKDEGFIHYRIQVPNVWLRAGENKFTDALESNGHMHHVTLTMNLYNNRIYVYEMNGEDWVEKYCADDFNPVSASASASFAGNNGAAISLLGMIRGEREENSILLFHVPGKIMMYRFFHESFEVLVDFTREYYFERSRLQFEFKDAYQFIESLAPV